MSLNGLGVVGQYERIVVKENTVAVADKPNLPIEWINPYTFYFNYAPGNEQIWIYDTTRFCLYQICNALTLDTFSKPHKRLSPVENIVEDDRQLGNYEKITIYEASVNVASKTLPITWINPHAFYFHYDATNLQVWIYDPEIGAYLQVGTWANSVRLAHARDGDRTHQAV